MQRELVALGSATIGFHQGGYMRTENFVADSLPCIFSAVPIENPEASDELVERQNALLDRCQL